MIRPIMDFMQTMPAFVFMIPVIAFFGTGKVAAVIITMIFGGTPVVRLTVLGLRGVPETIREAAIAYGASKWYLLRKVDLPLATPSMAEASNHMANRGRVFACHLPSTERVVPPVSRIFALIVPAAGETSVVVAVSTTGDPIVTKVPAVEEKEDPAEFVALAR